MFLLSQDKRRIFSLLLTGLLLVFFGHTHIEIQSEIYKMQTFLNRFTNQFTTFHHWAESVIQQLNRFLGALWSLITLISLIAVRAFFQKRLIHVTFDNFLEKLLTPRLFQSKYFSIVP